MFSSDLEVVHRHDLPVKTVRDDGLPKGSRCRLPPARRKRGSPKKVRLELESAVASSSSSRNGSSEHVADAVVE